MKKIIFLFLIFLFSCQSEIEKQQSYFNGYWSVKAENDRYKGKYPYINHIQDSIINILHPDLGLVEGNRFKVFQEDTLGISWNPKNENLTFYKSKFIIIDDKLCIVKNTTHTDSLTRLSKDKGEKIISDWWENVDIEIGHPRIK